MSETLNNHEENTGEGWDSLMSSLTEEAGKFDPKRATEAREKRMAERVGGAHLKPENPEGTKEETSTERAVIGKHLSPEAKEESGIEVGQTMEQIGGEDRAETEVGMSQETGQMGGENKAETEVENLYSREYRKQMNVPISDSFTKRRVVMEEQFPGLRPLSSGEELRRYEHDKEYKTKIDQMIDAVPSDVKEEYDLLGLMIGRLEDGISADLRPDDSLAGSEPNSIPMSIAEEGYGEMIVTKWKAEHAKQDLARLKELHEKNSEIVDFSHENEVDLNKSSEDVRKKIEDLKGEIEALKTAEYRDFESSGDKRPRTAYILDKIADLTRISNLSYEMRRVINQQKYELRKAYLRAEDAAKRRNIDAQIGDSQQGKTRIAERQKKNADAGFVRKMFGRLFDPNRAKREQE